jgi:surfeit locus 1 family protein
MTERPKFPVGLTISTAIAFLILIALGTWQVQRLHWKEGVLARIAALQAAPAQPLSTVLDRRASGAEVDFTRVSATCPGLSAAPFLELYAIKDGQAGSRLISACPAAGSRYGSILVDRGFVPDTVSARPPANPADQTPVALTGVLRKPDKPNWFSPKNTPKRWFTRDITAMAAALHVTNPAPVFLFAEASTNPQFKGLIPAPLPADIPNNHLQYALTWYGLAAALLGVYAAMLLKRRKG